MSYPSRKPASPTSLHTAEDSYRAIFNSANDAIFVHEIETGRILDVNQKMCELFGYSAEETRQLTVGDISSGEPPYSQPDAVHRIRKAAAEGPQVFEWLCKKRSGALFPVEVNLKRATIGGQERMLAIVRDITERKRAEGELQKERDQAERYLDIAGVMILALDVQGTITLINQKGCEILGCERKNVLGQNWFDNFVPQRYRRQIEDIFAHIMAGELDGIDRYENAVVNAAGEERTIQWHNVTLTDRQGRRIGTLSSGEDVTDHKILEGQLRHAQKMEGIGRLAGGVAHDFNNILQAILGYVDLALDQTDRADSRHEILGRVREGAERAATLTEQLLTFSRRQVLAPQQLDLGKHLTGMMQMLRRVIREDIELEFRSGPSPNIIHADPGQVEQAILNLCLNARDAIPESGRIRIETRSTILSEDFCRDHPGARTGRFVVLSVTDSGTGMNDDTQRRMFEPFFTTKKVGKGTGLGLATVHGIVKQHDGFLIVQSELGAGTTFEIYLPEITGAGLEGTVGPGAGADATRATVLVAEDDEMVRELNRRILEEAGYRVLAAADGRAAVEAFRAHATEISLALLDVVMPKLGGLDVLKRIRAINPSVRVLFSSGYSPEIIDAQFIQDETVQVIRKPHSRQALLEKVQEALAGQPTAACSTE